MRKSHIEAIKMHFRIAPFVAPHTGGLKPSGRGFFMGQCPFHKSDKPRRKFWVNTASDTCGCFVPRCPAYCNKADDPTSKPLDVINFYALVNKISNEEAIKNLAQMIGLDP